MARYTFYLDSIEIIDYYFSPSTVYPARRLQAFEIAEINPIMAPPALRIGDELIFISAEFSGEIRAFGGRNNIPVIRRFDLWASILEPFLDTEFSEEHKERTLKSLENYGLRRATVRNWRNRITRPMMLYNFGTMLWEWIHLGQWDLLEAHRHIHNTAEFSKLYWDSMKVALKAY